MVKDPLEMDAPVARITGKKALREVTLHLRVTVEMLARIDQQAEKEQRNRSDMLRMLIMRGWQKT